MKENSINSGCIELKDELAADFYTNQDSFVDNHPELELKLNQYIIIGEDVYCYQDNNFRKVPYPYIKNDFLGELKPRNVRQVAALNMLQDDRTTIKLITGTWGTGKTMLLSAAAIDALENNKFDKIVWVRNNVQVKDTDALGALPGSELEKVLPYVMPLADHCGGIDGLMKYIDTGRLEVIPLGFLRGRSIRNAIIMCSEAENLTKEHLQLIIARVDEGSNVWFDADIRQRDKVVFEKSQGIETMIKNLSGEELFGYVHLTKSERSKTAALADKL